MREGGLHPIPEAWPMLMTIDQACAYLGGMDGRTFHKICPVFPVDIGANIVRYRRADLDTWASGLRPRLNSTAPAVNDSAPAAETMVDTPDQRRDDAITRAIARATGGHHGKRRRA
ncbi:hypothetical protein ABAC460_10040 [Asticcacaulis sp. AC460]|uniref:hypothetical protein n=1 Tax=Asticcacaulis sp. AC460 TaxID=1282360 RepID=UPI0003C3C062|nr:hypothetical protein [Asticcacaulis sp. AC460]ESQ90098.1 hypothetical protein ABAC460_10040 [Asticcacaulis sp. AC460]